MATGPDYCELSDVTSILYAGQGLAPGDPAPTDSTRDARIAQLITQTSRDFDSEVIGNASLPGLFVPKYETRLYSGMGSQELDVDPYVVIAKIEQLVNPGQPIATQTWTDYTSEIAAGRIGLLPLRSYPKSMIFRQSSFYKDPFPLGNVRITGLWGILLPDPAGAKPVAPWNGLAQPAIDALTPDGAGGGGWWVMPDDVPMAVATWVAFRFEEGKSVHADQPGSNQPGIQNERFPSKIPDDVMRTILKYKGDTGTGPKFALVNADGTEDEMTSYRWAGWQTSGPDN